jgi:hypothetical protein
MDKSGRAPGYLTSARYSWLILAITALACSRIMLALFHDPEGPNLVVVGGMAAAIYLISLAAYLSNVSPLLAGHKRIAVAVGIQLFIATGFYFWLR